MGVTLYHFSPSAPCRSVLLVVKALGLEVDIQNIDVFKKQHLTEDFTKINPQHTVPTLVDDDFTLWDSHAIVSYLVRTYGKDDSLYPTDVKHQATINQRLQFDASTLYPRIRAICFPILFFDEIEVSEDKKSSLDEALGFLDIFLDGQDFVAGNKLTVADCVCVASVSSIIAVGWNISPYPNVEAWIARCASTIPEYAEANQFGADMYGKAVKSKMARGQI